MEQKVYVQGRFPKVRIKRKQTPFSSGNPGTSLPLEVGIIPWVKGKLKIIKVNKNKVKEDFMLMAQKPSKRASSGFTLIESLISLSLFLLILASSFELFVSVRNHFFSLKEEQEVNLAAYATLDKIRLDLCECGRGLVDPQFYGLLDAIVAPNNTLTIQSKDRDISLGNNLVAGQTYIPLASTAGIKKGQKLCFTDPEKGEVKTIISVDKHGLTLNSSLNSSYIKDEVKAILVRTISCYLDEETGILRRKVNTSPAQPLLDDVVAFNVIYEKTFNVISLRLILRTKEEKKYEASVFPKNMALVPSQ
jgi:prepilin-type N-terminal cleavage/methylation domain-containing protein